MAFEYTPEQQKVIELRNRNILVAAAAGSGKTAVLVQRILQMISSSDLPIDIDRLLIVTFTSAAAAEMRERISDAIAKKLEEYPENEHLQKQSALIHNAQITTIDSFCLFVIRNNFNDIGLDPAFRVADEGELKLLKQDTMKDMLEDYFAAQDKEFEYCLECFSANGSEKPLAEQILQIHEFSMSFPWPMAWLEERKLDYQIEDGDDLQNFEWMQFLMEDCTKIVKDCVLQLQEAQAICLEPDGPYMYEETLQVDRENLTDLLGSCEEEDFVQIGERLHAISFGRLPIKKDETVNPIKREAAKEIRNRVKEQLGDLKENYYYTSLEQIIEDSKQTSRLVHTLLLLTQEYQKRFAERKRAKNLIDFSDMEHFALEILMREEEGNYVPSQTALDYREYFAEILIDEYQDSNMVQEYLLKSISGEQIGNYNRFMVGDVKQSIYKFRLARPEIFMEKYNTYTTSEHPQKQRIDLHKNFRSRYEVIESVNYIFRQIMGKQLGNVDYDSEAALYLGADFKQSQENYQTELLLFEKEEEKQPDKKNPDKKEAEARMTACRIREMVGTFLVTDKETGLLRPAKYKDIVVLLRTNAGWDEPFKRALNEQGIPVYIASKTGYFSAVEVQTVLQFLRVVDNPLQDIPLFGVLKAPFVRFSEEEIAWIKGKAEQKNKKLWKLLLEYMQQQSTMEERDSFEEGICKKIDCLKQFLFRYREMAVYTPIQKLIQNFIHETGYLNYVRALPAGEQRYANLMMLLQKASDFEKTSYFGLFHFIRYMEQMEKYDIDYGEAGVLDENADTVRIMSVHKSKGLEFPICFVCGISKRMNMMDSNKAFIMDVDLGIGAQCVKPEFRLKTTTLQRNVISRKLQLDNLGEELRILYVALTRAKEKLILTGTVDNLTQKILASVSLLKRKEEKLPFSTLSEARSYLDFIIPVLMRHRSFESWLEPLGLKADEKNTWNTEPVEFEIRVFHASELVQEDFVKQVDQMVLKKQLPLLAETAKDFNLKEQIESRFSYEYKHKNLNNLFTKTTVSELKKAGMEEPENVSLFPEKEAEPYYPRFVGREVEVTGSQRGNAYHKTMEILELERMQESKTIETDLEDFLKEKVEQGILKSEFADCIELQKMKQFCNTALAGRMGMAEKRHQLFREQPFVMGISAKELKKDFPEDEQVLIQGIIDVYFEEDGELVVADYKTDRVKGAEVLVERYHKQLEYYALALEQLTAKRVKEKIIYSFDLGLEILVE